MHSVSIATVSHGGRMKSKTDAGLRNQVRIIGGVHRGRKLVFADAPGLRPTADSVRERLFNWLGQDLTGQRVLDLFSGSGALGLEAASRRAASVVLVEQHRRTAAQLRAQVRSWNEADRVQVEEEDALLYLRRPAVALFDGVLLDPPFVWQQWPQLWPLLRHHLATDGWVYVEAGQLPVWPQWLWPVKQGRAGMSHYALLRVGAVADEPAAG